MIYWNLKQVFQGFNITYSHLTFIYPNILQTFRQIRTGTQTSGQVSESGQAYKNQDNPDKIRTYGHPSNTAVQKLSDNLLLTATRMILWRKVTTATKATQPTARFLRNESVFVTSMLYKAKLTTRLHVLHTVYI